MVTPGYRYKQKSEDGFDRVWCLPRVLRDQFQPWIIEIKAMQFTDTGNHKKQFVFIDLFFFKNVCSESMSCFESLYIWVTNIDILRKYSTLKILGPGMGVDRYTYMNLNLMLKVASLVEEERCRLRGEPARWGCWMPCRILKITWNSGNKRNSQVWVIALLLYKLYGLEVVFDLFIHLFIFNICPGPSWVVCKQ